MKFPFKSYKERGGIQAIVEENRANTPHQAFGWPQFEASCELDIPNSVIARQHNIGSVNTIKRWKAERQELIKEPEGNSHNE